jgi:predicted ATPase
MRITRIEVDRLFNTFNHVIPLSSSEPITIMIGPNGFGKTTILRMINTVFNQSMRGLARIPFTELRIHLDNGGALSVTRTVNDTGTADIDLYFVIDKLRHSFRPEPVGREVDFPLSAIERFVPELERVGPEEWRNARTGEFMVLEQVLDRYWENLPTSSTLRQTPDWLKELRDSLKVRLIDTERLTQPLALDSKSNRPLTHARAMPARTVRRYAEELGGLVKKTLADYGELSQSLDRTFPARLVAQPSQLKIPRDQLRQELAQVEERRKQIIDAGLLREEHRYSYFPFEVPDLDQVEESRQSVLAVYANDAREKLNVFNELYRRVAALTGIANSRLLHKRVIVGPEGLSVVTPGGQELAPELLSSGEQHELVILYELLFKVEGNALILIDEPELSLHVAWQHEILADLAQIAKLSNFQAILATHSPQIIGDRWDLTVELDAPSGR